jgi:hypothetical protein
VLAPFAAVITYVDNGDFGLRPRSWSWRSAKAFYERRESGQTDFFKARLDQIVGMNDPLASRAIDWGFLGESLGAVNARGHATFRSPRSSSRARDLEADE